MNTEIKELLDMEFNVPVAGHSKKLAVKGWRSTCGKIKDGIGFEFDNDGGWVISLETLEKIVAIANIIRKNDQKI